MFIHKKFPFLTSVSWTISAMFTNRNIAKSVTVGVDKMRHVVNYVIAPVFKRSLIDSVKKTSFCSIVW